MGRRTIRPSCTLVEASKKHPGHCPMFTSTQPSQNIVGASIFGRQPRIPQHAQAKPQASKFATMKAPQVPNQKVIHTTHLARELRWLPMAQGSKYIHGGPHVRCNQQRTRPSPPKHETHRDRSTFFLSGPAANSNESPQKPYPPLNSAKSSPRWGAATQVNNVCLML